jgi:hypothetical protein
MVKYVNKVLSCYYNYYYFLLSFIRMCVLNIHARDIDSKIKKKNKIIYIKVFFYD